MSPDSLQHLRQYFSQNSCVRGDAYASGGRVRIARAPHDGDGMLRAEVQGSDLYRVTLQEDGTAVDVACDCPYFEREGELCKHIWATLLEAARIHAFGDRVFRQIEIGDEFFDAGKEGLENLRNQLSYPGTNGRYGSRVVPLVPAWKQSLQAAGRSLRYASYERTLPAYFQLHYTLEPHGSSVVLEIGLRSPKKNGDLSKPRAMAIPLTDINKITDPLDRQILAILSSGISDYEETIPANRPLRLPALQHLLPILASTGRLSVRFGGATIDDVQWNEQPWQLVLEVVRNKNEYELTGSIRRGSERLPIPTNVLGGALVLHDKEVAPLDSSGADGMLKLLQRQQTVRVPERDGEDLLQVLMTAAALPPIELPPELTVDIRRAEPLPLLRLAKSPYAAEFTAAVSFDYDGVPVDAWADHALYDRDIRAATLRNFEKERALLAALLAAGFRRGYGGELTIASKQLWSALPPLITAGWRIDGSEGIFRSGGEISLSISSGIDWFDLEATVRFGSASAALPDVLTAVRKGESFVPLDDGSLGLISNDWRERLEPFTASVSEQHKGALRFRSNQMLLIDTLLAGRDDVEFDHAFVRARKRIADLQPVAEEPTEGFRGTLRPYQKEGLGWMTFLRELGFGGCLADDMGLGKTVQVLAMLEARRQKGEEPFRPSLVVAPRTLIFNWRSEAERFTPALRVVEHASPERSRNHEDFSGFDLVLTTYGTLRRDAALLAAAEFDYVILDEAQTIKNSSSQAAKAARLLRARHRLALTGTPIENHIGELWSLFEFLNPGMLGGSSSRIPSWLKLAGGKGDEAEHARAVVARVLRPFILRRTKGEVARELPERVEQTIVCDLEPKQRAVYEALRQSYRQSLLERVESAGLSRSKIHVLEALLRLRQAACHPALVSPRHAHAGSAKLDSLISEISVLLEEQHKVLVFSQFTSFLALVRAELDKQGIVYEYLDGKTRDRGERVRRFQEDPAVGLFLISLKAGGLGLNLTAAEYVFLLDPWWNPAVEAQAIDRAHRIGQDRTVVAYRLIARDTIEEKILVLQKEKRALADAILTEDNSVLRQLTREDLDLLLS
jgi:superfamily II DNA or RNA helicase